MREVKVKYTILFIITNFLATMLFAQNSIKFETKGQKYGVADLDCFWLSDSETEDGIYYSKFFTDSDEATTGTEIWRSEAINLIVWGQFGTKDTPNYPAQAGFVQFNHIPGEGEKYLRIR